MPKKLSSVRQITQFKKKEISALFKRARVVYKDNCFHISQANIEKPTNILPEHEDSPLGKLLIVTPKKIGTAPERNKLRRRLKSIFYEEKLFLCPVKTIIFCKTGSTQINFDDLKNMLLMVFSKRKKRRQEE